MTHEIVRENRTQSLSHPVKGGKKATWSELFPEALIEELWELIEYIAIPGRFHFERVNGAPRRGKNGDVGIRFRVVKDADHRIVFSFQEKQKSGQTMFELEPPNNLFPFKSLVGLRTHLDELVHNRDQRGRLVLPEDPKPKPRVVPVAPIPPTPPIPPTKPTPPVGEPKVEVDWENERLHQVFMRLVRELDSGYSEGWIPTKDIMPLVGLALEECGMEIPEMLDGRTSKRLFTALIEQNLLERTGKAHSLKYRECRKKSLALSGNLIADVERLTKLAARFEKLDGIVKSVEGSLGKLTEEREALRRRLETLDEEIGQYERDIQTARREIDSERLDEAAELLARLRTTLGG